MAITEQRVNAGELYIRFVGGVEYHRTRAQLVAALAQEGGRKDRLQSRCIEEIRALVGGLADEIVVDLENDGTPKNVAWYDPSYRLHLEAAGLLPRRR